LMVWDND